MDAWFMQIIQFVGFGLLGLFALLVVFLIINVKEARADGNFR